MAETRTTTLTVRGMSCVACEQRIARALAPLHGVATVTAHFESNTVELTFDGDPATLAVCTEALAAAHYPVVDPTKPTGLRKLLLALALLLVALGGYVLLQRSGIFTAFPLITQQMSLPVLFLVGVTTSLHCIAMCGGIAISQTTGKALHREKTVGHQQPRAPKQQNRSLASEAPPPAPARLLTLRNLRPSSLYNLGRVISYTVIGGIVGALGSAFSVSIELRGMLLLVAALFMLLMGATMLGLFAPLRRFVPHLPRGFSARVGRVTAGRGPLVVGLLNGFLPCGPLQTVQLYALSTGSFIMGAASMLVFSLGTVPLLFVLGAANTLLNERFSRIMTMVSAALVLMLGFAMLANALGLFGVVIPF